MWSPMGPFPDGLETHTDADWARDARTRKSVSSAVILWGPLTLVTVVRSQAAGAQSSCESEVYAIASGLSETIGIRGALEFLGVGRLALTIRTDASAALAVANRQGTGRIRHLSVKVLWIQQAVRQQLAKVVKIPTDRNLADLGTEPLELAPFERLRRSLGRIRETPELGVRVPQGIYAGLELQMEQVVSAVTQPLVDGRITIAELVRFFDRVCERQ